MLDFPDSQLSPASSPPPPIRTFIPFDTLRSELYSRLSFLKHELNDLINRDYNDFINLITKLVDVDGAVVRMQAPKISSSTVACVAVCVCLGPPLMANDRRYADEDQNIICHSDEEMVGKTHRKSDMVGRKKLFTQRRKRKEEEEEEEGKKGGGRREEEGTT